jgi:hypothetical protein
MKYGGLSKLLQKFIPGLTLRPHYKGKAVKAQKAALRCIEKLFPNLNVIQNHKHADLTNPKTTHRLELDVSFCESISTL